MAQITNYSKYINSIYKDLTKRCKTNLWKDDLQITEILKIYRFAIYNHIHNYLVPLKTANAEKEIREIISKYVIGYQDSRKKEAYIGALELIDNKIAQFKDDKVKNKRITAEKLSAMRAKMEMKRKYEDLKDDFMALASFRSMRHYFLYMQKVFNFTLWEDTQNCFEGYWYYGGRMILDGSVKFLEKQCPTGFGKSVSDAFMQSWCYGIDIDNTCFKVCGNDKFTEDCFNNVISLMLSAEYAKVFPYYEQFEGKREKMFKFCSTKDLQFGITGSKKAKNLLICTKLSDTNGVRAKFLYLDDITQRRDMSNMDMHNKDIHSFVHEWYERKDKDSNFYIIASGTTYSQFDILSYLKLKGGGELSQKSPINKYTYIAKSDLVIENGISVFVSVPLLDPETDESTYPKKISTEKARKKREEHPEEFWAMDMQKPLPPDSSPFYFTRLRQYTALPLIGENGRTDTCVAALDTKRRGADYLSMPILFEAQDQDNKNSDAFYLVDWLYDDRPMKDCIPLIVAKIIQRKITRLFVERNTEECIETLLSDKLKEQGYTACVIEEIYSTEPKDRRIMNAEGDIKSKIIFPQYGMYAPSNDVGKALMNVYGYTYNKKVEHDDAADSLALFAKHFIMDRRNKYATMSTFRR